MSDANEVLFISWAPFCSRSDSIAARLGGRSVMVYSKFWGSHPATVIFKYLAQTFATLRLLIRERPRVIFVMTPPVVACFGVWLYTLFSRAQFIIDAHTGSFLMPRWQRLIFLHKWASRRALTTVVTNQYLYDLVASWGASATLVPDVPVLFAEPSDFVPAGKTNMTMVSTFTHDEPIDIFLEAAAKMPDVNFYVTGDARRASPETHAKRPENVVFTGFLPDEDYVALLKGSDAMICLTTYDYTMQRGAYESLYLSRPVIVSDYGVLRDAFPTAAVYVDNTVDGIVAGVRRMQAGHDNFESEAVALREFMLERWQRVTKELRGLWGAT